MSTGSALLVDQDGYVVGRILKGVPQRKRVDKVYIPVGGVLSNKTRPEDFARFAEIARSAQRQVSPPDDVMAVEEAPAIEVEVI